jgi:DNA mismatch repair protein MutS
MEATAEAAAPLTPMMRQYLELKERYPKAILFFRLGDFYEMFFDDAIKAAEVLQIALTSRSKGEGKVPMCGVPYHSARRYVAKLIEQGHNVAICDQMEEPGKGPGIVRRDVTRVVTPGMVLDDEVLSTPSNNFLASLCFEGAKAGAAILDVSTGEFFVIESPSVSQLSSDLSAFELKEILVSDKAQDGAELTQLLPALGKAVALATLDEGAFSPRRAEAYLASHFQVASLDGFGLAEAPLGARAAGAALRYLKDTQKTEAPHVDRIRVWKRDGQLLLDDSTCANLEIVRSLRDGGRKGTLLGVLDKTSTGMGARKLARWVMSPLRSLPEISARQDAVEELASQSVLRKELCASLKQIADFERLCARLSLGAGNARDLLSLSTSLSVLPELAHRLSQCEASLLKALAGPLSSLPELAALLQRAVAEDPPLQLKEGGLIRQGFHAELDELIALSTSGKEVLLRIETREKERTGISSLKVRYNKVFGYYLEVTKANLHLVPADYIRKQTTVGAERFITEELKEYEEKVLTAEEKRCALEYRLFEELRGKVIAQAGALRSAAEAVAVCDTLTSLASCAAEYGYVRPVVDDSSVIDITDGRHPVIERVLQREPFVPNDVRLDREESQLLIITGPNMAGKSTVMRQTALIALLAQAGSFVPARSARIGLCDRIFTRVGAADNLARGQSTFMVEMTETANILHHATSQSLVILDEIGRGTSTFDGLSIAWAVAESLHDHSGARTLFATHYHELTDLAREKPRVKNCSIAVKEQRGKIVFLRKLVAGAANRSYGIEVARLAGLPAHVLLRAREILENLESGELDEKGRPRLSHRNPDGKGSEQLSFFAGSQAPPEHRAFLEELEAVKLDELTPIAALNLIAKWKKAQ